MSKSKEKSNPPQGGSRPVLPSPYASLAFICFCVICALFSAPVTMALAGLKIAVLISMPEGQKRSGRSGTVVWKRNNQMRVFAFPRLVRNTYTTYIRSLISNFSSDWNLLTPAQQASWLNMVGYEKQDRLGNKFPLRGKALYCSANTNLSLMSVASIVTALPPIAIDVFTSAAPVVSVGGATITMAPLTSSVNWGIKYWATSRVSAGTNSPGQNKFRLFKAADDSTAPPTPAQLYTAYVARFGAPSVGDTIFIYAQFVGAGNGQDGGRSLTNKVVVAA